MLDKYKDEQAVAYKILNNALLNNKLSHAYLFDTNYCNDSYDFVLSFVKSIICLDVASSEEKENICKRIDDNNYLDVKVIEADGMWIKKEQMLNLQEEFTKKAFEGNKKIYIIKSADKMNAATANSILKFLEEPVDEIIAILVTDNINLILPTIMSRCQIIKLSGRSKVIDSLFTDFKIGTEDQKNIIKNVLDFAIFLENNGLNTIVYSKKVWHVYFKDRNYNILAVEILINLYYDIVRFKNGLNPIYFVDVTDSFSEIANSNTTNNLIRKIEVLDKIKNDLKYNLNVNLLIDRMIIEMCGDINENSRCKD